MNLEDFLYVCHMKGFMRKIVAFLFAVIFGLTSAIFLSAGADNELVKPQDPSYPYSLIDVRAQSLPMQSFYGDYSGGKRAMRECFTLSVFSDNRESRRKYRIFI